MNLYRNFGSLFESWVTEGCLDLHSQEEVGVVRLDSVGSDSVSGDSVRLSNVKSESEDSGVETVSTISPCHSHQSSAATSEDSNLTLQITDSTEDDGQPSFFSSAPSVCSSSSSCVSFGTVAPRSTSASLKVEQALRRSESGSGRISRRGPSHPTDRINAVQQFHRNTIIFSTTHHKTNSRTHYRSTSPKRSQSQPPDQQKAELYRRLLYDQAVEKQLEFEQGEQCRPDKLSPGLLYLEQVCKLLENTAKLHQQNHNLRMEVETLKSHHTETECASLHEKETNFPAIQRLEVLGHEDQTTLSTHLKEPTGFRHRSVSDTQAAVGRCRRARFVKDEPFAGVLLEEPDSADSLPEIIHKKPNKIQKLKFTSFRGPETQKPDTESKGSQPKKNTRLANLFKSRRLTTRL